MPIPLLGVWVLQVCQAFARDVFEPLCNPQHLVSGRSLWGRRRIVASLGAPVVAKIKERSIAGGPAVQREDLLSNRVNVGRKPIDLVCKDEPSIHVLTDFPIRLHAKNNLMELGLGRVSPGKRVEDTEQ